jgi:acetyl-CoA synthetase
MHDANLLEDQPIAWTPTPDVIERAQLTKFMRQVGVSTWDELYEFSIRDVEKFTEEVLKFLDIKFDPPYEKLLDISNGVEQPTWLSGAGLNIAEMCLDRWQTDEMKDQPAVIWEGEDGRFRTLSYSRLKEYVDTCVTKLAVLGVEKGDAIGIHLPMLPETVVALLAINRIGAIAVPVFSGYGIDAISSRMEAVGAKALFTCFGTTRRGKAVDMLTVAARAVANVASISSVILVGGKGPAELGVVNFALELERLEREVFGGRAIAHLRPDEFFEVHNIDPRTETSAEDPLIILYTSGTTGKPKGIAHTHASFPIKAAQDMAFGTDVGRGTRICWYTDIGWMMGPWLIYGALINGATICIYDGAPDHPTPDRMWEFCAKHRVEVLGISPTLVRALAAAEDKKNSPPYEGGVAGVSPDVVVLSSC